jgi:hypothetical protein
MRMILITTGLTLALSGGIALAQTGSGASSGGASSAGSTTGRGGSTTGAPANPGTAAPATGAVDPGTRSRSPVAPTNSQIYPPSRLLQSGAPSVTAPASSDGSEPGAPKSRVAQPGAGESGGTRLQPGPASTASTGSTAPGRNLTGKNALNQEYADCIRLWDAGTHMTRTEWSRTCRRIQTRLNRVGAR